MFCRSRAADVPCRKPRISRARPATSASTRLGKLVDTPPEAVAFARTTPHFACLFRTILGTHKERACTDLISPS